MAIIITIVLAATSAAALASGEGPLAVGFMLCALLFGILAPWPGDQ